MSDDSPLKDRNLIFLGAAVLISVTYMMATMFVAGVFRYRLYDLYFERFEE